MIDVASVSPLGNGPGNWLYRHLPRPRLHASANGVQTQPKRVLVFIKGENASFDYYLAARLQALGLPHEVRCIDRDGLHDIDMDGLLVIICRYIRPRQAKWIERNRNCLAGVAYFVDDDIPALVADRHSAFDYRLYLAYFACLPMMRLNGLLTHIWVSTPALARALGTTSGQPAVLAPAPVIEDHMPVDRQSPEFVLKIVYHATNTHQLEHAFLVPVIEEVMRRRPDVRFEVLARGKNKGLWKRASISSERMRILPPMGWQEYRNHSRDQGADIALMPLLDGLANASRADTKLVDCCRMGAATMLSDVAPYRRSRENGGFMVGNSPEKWIEGLLVVIDRADRRNAAREATRSQVLAMKTPSQPFPGICGPGDRGATT